MTVNERGAGPLDPWGHNRPQTSDGRYLAGYASHAQVRDAMESRGFYYSHQRREWRNASTGASIAEGYELDWLAVRR